MEASGIAKQNEMEIFHEGSEEKRRLALGLHQRIVGNIIDILHCVYLIKTQRLYLDLGFKSLTEYADNIGVMSRRQFFRFLDISEKFAEISETPTNEVSANAALTTNEVSANAALTDGEVKNTLESPLSMVFGKLNPRRLGMSKLEQLSRLEDEHIRKIVEEGELTLADGTLVTTDELASMRVKDLETEVRRLKKKLKLSNEEKAFLKSEKLEIEKEIAEYEAEGKDGYYKKALDEKLAELEEIRGKKKKEKAALAAVGASYSDFMIGINRLNELEISEDPRIRGELLGITENIMEQLTCIRRLWTGGGVFELEEE